VLSYEGGKRVHHGADSGPSQSPVGPLSAQLRRPRPRSATSAVRRLPPVDCSRPTPPQGRFRTASPSLDVREQNANTPAWTAGTIASPITPLSWSGLLAASARAAGHIASPDWLRNSGQRSAFATSRTASPTTAFGGPRRGRRKASRPVESTCRTLSSRAHSTRRQAATVTHRLHHNYGDLNSINGQAILSYHWWH
jgi:hypothetical protein